MTHTVLIDYDVIGWANENETLIHKDYEDIQRVGEDPNPQRTSPDEAIADYCEEKNFDLLTGDKRAYTKLLMNKRVKAVQISKFDTYKIIQIYLVKIL